MEGFDILISAKLVCHRIHERGVKGVLFTIVIQKENFFEDHSTLFPG
jgi:hypothetical protein